MLDFQISIYSWAISKMLGLHDVTFIYDIIRKPMQKLKRNESEDAYLERIASEIAEDMDGYFIRDKVTRSRREIERTEEELIIRARELVQRRQDGLIYRTPGDHCHWKCDFMTPCLEENEEIWTNLYNRVDHPHQELVTE